MFGRLFRRRPGMEAMLAALAEAGIAPRPGMDATALLAHGADFDPPFTRARIEAEGHESLLILLAAGDDVPPPDGLGPAPCAALWHFDTECIEDHGDYVRIVERLCALSGGVLAPERVADHVDVEGGDAWVEITEAGKTERIVLRVDDDWVDGAVFAAMQQRLAATGSTLSFVAHALGQDMLVACLAPEAIARLNALPGLRFEPLG